MPREADKTQNITTKTIIYIYIDKYYIIKQNINKQIYIYIYVNIYIYIYTYKTQDKGFRGTLHSSVKVQHRRLALVVEARCFHPVHRNLVVDFF